MVLKIADCFPLTVVAEIQERWDFLKEMEALGRGRQYYNIINTEISQVTSLWQIVRGINVTSVWEGTQKT